MVSLQHIRASNGSLPTSYPSGIVAVFVGATSGIGEYTLLQFARHVVRPRVYFVGRSQAAGQRVLAECQKLNQEGSFTFIQADLSDLKNVEVVCKEIKEQEQSINVLFLSQGSLDPTVG